MGSRFRVLESLISPNAAQPPIPWRERSVAGNRATTYEVSPTADAVVEPFPSSTGTHPLVPFSLDSIEPHRPGTGKLVHPSTPLTDSTPRQTATLRPLGARGADPEIRHTGYLTGISLSGILQMLHMERNSCVLEVTAGGRLGTLTMVNGELIDAEVDDRSGDAVAMQILRWPYPVTAILPSGALVRHSVSMPLTRLLMDAVRLQDEAIVVPESPWIDDGPPPPMAAETPARWRELPARLVALGAAVALVMTATGDEPVAEAGTSLDQFTPTAAVARGVRTWSSLLVDGVDRVHVIAGPRRLVLATLTADNDAIVYAETPADMPLGSIWQAIADAS